MQSRKILGVRIDFGFTLDSALNFIEDNLLKDRNNHIVCTTNPEFIVDAQEDPEFKKIINESSLSTPDGIGVVYARKYIDKVNTYKKNFLFPLKALLYGVWLGISTFLSGSRNIKNERITGVDLTYKICELSAKKGYSIFFLGGRRKNAVGKLSDSSDSDVSNMAEEKIKKMYPNVNIVGSTSKFNRDPKDDEKTVDFIKDCMRKKSVNNIDFLFVAYNHIYQEKWIMRNKDKISAKVSIGCGGTFDFIVGNCHLPPTIYAKNNLGWLYRLFKQPWRYKRILKAFPIFPMKIYLNSIEKK